MLRTALLGLLALALVCGGIELGNWQLRRAAQKEALQAELDAKAKLAPLDQQAFLALGDARQAMHQPVHLRGLWLTPQTVYLDNRQMHGVPGFYVVTPFALLGTEQTILVQRGWIQRNFESRETLQPVETPPGLVDIEGLVAPPPAHLLELGKADATAASASPAAPVAPADAVPAGAPAHAGATDAPAASTAPTAPSAAPAAKPADAPAATPAAAHGKAGAKAAPVVVAAMAAPPGAGVGSSAIRQNLDLEAYRLETGLPLRTDVIVQQSGAASQGLQRDWPAPAFGVERHYGYAFQWFGLSALVALLYAWFQFIVPLRRRRRRARRR